MVRITFVNYLDSAFSGHWIGFLPASTICNWSMVITCHGEAHWFEFGLGRMEVWRETGDSPHTIGFGHVAVTDSMEAASLTRNLALFWQQPAKHGKH